jgi:response regulator RpfG family c-di-GMP phosphodiesterase
VLAKDEALDNLRAESGKLYDPVVVDTIAHLQSGDLLRQRVETDGRMVVVADPDEGVRTDLNDALNKLGLVVHTVLKLDGVIDAVLAGESDTLVVGLGYGVQDLVNLAGFVRGRPESASLPILVVGEPTDPQTRERLANVGISAFVPTPLNPDDAAGVVRALYADRIENGGPGHTVRGSFDELAATELAKLLGKGKKTGRLVVRNGPQEGYVHLEKGRAVFASFAGKQAEPAIEGMLSLRQAEFSWEPEVLLTEAPHADRDLEVIAREAEHHSGDAAS